MILALIIILAAVPIAASAVHRKRIKKRATQFVYNATAPTPPLEVEDIDLSDRSFALAWYRAGIEKGWDMKTKDVLVTDLTVEQAFAEEWDALAQEEEDEAES